MVIELEKISEFEVLYQGAKLPIVDKNKPTGASVDLDKLGLEGYQRYVKISTLEIGLNTIELKAKRIVEISKVEYTEEEKAELAQLEARINEIKENAKRRYIPKTKKSIYDMSIEELEEYIRIKKGQ